MHGRQRHLPADLQKKPFQLSVFDNNKKKKKWIEKNGGEPRKKRVWRGVVVFARQIRLQTRERSSKAKMMSKGSAISDAACFDYMNINFARARARSIGFVRIFSFFPCFFSPLSLPFSHSLFLHFEAPGNIFFHDVVVPITIIVARGTGARAGACSAFIRGLSISLSRRDGRVLLKFITVN